MPQKVTSPNTIKGYRDFLQSYFVLKQYKEIVIPQETLPVPVFRAVHEKGS